MKYFYLPLILTISVFSNGFCQFTLLSTQPGNNYSNVDIDQPIIFQFNESVHPTVAMSDFSLVSNLRGKLAGLLTTSGSKITITPVAPFLYGEIITVTALASLKSSANTPLYKPLGIQFLVKSKTSPRNPPTMLASNILYSQGIITKIGASDMDGDNDIDIFAFYGADIVWLENDGEENFSKHTIKTGVSFPSSLNAFDIDQDGDMDLIASSNYSGLMIFKNDGNQNFNQVFSINEFSINSFDIADFDSDGRFDIVYSSLDGSSGYASSTYILYNQGSGGFNKVKINSSGFYEFICTDLDNDNDPDIVHYNDSGIYYSLNTGNNFTTHTVFQDDNTVYEKVLVSDMNNDNRQDIIFLKYGYSTPSLEIYSNSESLEFTSAKIGTYMSELSAIGDYDGDGDNDIMILDDNYTYSILTNGSKSFEKKSVAQPLSGIYYPTNSVNADFDGDGDLDFLTSPNSIIQLYKNTVYEFEQKSLPAITSISNDADWGDFDNDGDLDLLVTGNGVSSVYENQNGSLIGKTADLMNLWSSSCDWGDYDNDGDLDILLSGSSRLDWDDRGPISVIYTNDNGIFTLLTSSLNQLPKIWFGESRWADFNNDGNLDIVFSGADYAGVYSNDGRGNFLKQVDFPFAVSWSNVDVGDFDKDGYLDIAFSGYTAGAILGVLRNEGNWKFSNVSGNFVGRFGGNISWSDMDNDGNLDLTVSGMQRNENGNTSPSITVYRNLGNSFSAIENTEFLYQGDEEGTIATGDYDNDGLPDLLATTSGGSSFEPDMNLFRNTGMGDLKLSAITLPNLALHSANWIDLDRDHDLDIFAGSKVMINNIQKANSPPSPPSDVEVDSVYNNSIYFHWNTGQDVETPNPGLSYQIYVGTEPGRQNIINSNSHLNNGFRKVVELGRWKGRQAIVENLFGGKYFFGVQSIDVAFEGSSFSEESQILIIGIHGSRGACLNSEYVYTTQPSGSYTWHVTGGTVISGQGTDSVVVNWHTLGTGYVGLSDPQGNRNKIPVEIEKSPNPIIEGDLTVCTGLQIYSQTDSLSYHSIWMVSGTNLVTNESTHEAIIEWVSSGEFDLIVQSFPKYKGCFLFDTVRVSVDQKPKPVVEGPESVCANQVEQYFTKSIKTEWQVNNGIILADSSAYINVLWPPNTGNGLVLLKEESKNAYCSSNDSLIVTINPRPPKPYLTVLNDTIVLASESPNGFYKWYFNDELAVEGNYIGIVPSFSGSVAVEVFNWEGCGSLSDTLAYYISEDINDVKVFPNPADQYLAIEWTSKYFDDVEIFIYALSNTLVRSYKVTKPWATIMESIDISELAPGVYILKLKERDKVYTIKFVKR